MIETSGALSIVWEQDHLTHSSMLQFLAYDSPPLVQTKTRGYKQYHSIIIHLWITAKQCQNA